MSTREVIELLTQRRDAALQKVVAMWEQGVDTSDEKQVADYHAAFGEMADSNKLIDSTNKVLLSEAKMQVTQAEVENIANQGKLFQENYSAAIQKVAEATARKIENGE